MIDSAALRARLADIRDRIARAADRAGRDPSSILLVAVSKTFSVDHVRAAADAGQRDFGENKIQEAMTKMAATTDLSLRWHHIGHLQSNKAKKAAEFDALHGIDRTAVLQAVDRASQTAGRAPDAFIQVDLAQEPTKFGTAPADLPPIFAVAAQCRAARVRGLMTLPPAFADPEGARPFFRQLRGIRDDLLRKGVAPTFLGQLSMGMSHDFEVAIEEGATMIRVGSAVFGERQYS